MRISELTEATTYDESCYMPISIDGATYKTLVEHVTPNVANNLTTTTEGYVLDARQGKVLKDAIDSNASAIATTGTTVQTGVVVDDDQWTLYDSRTDNSTTLYYPRRAKEVLLSMRYSDLLFTAMFVNDIIDSDFQLYMGGYYTNSSWSEYNNFYYVNVHPETHAIDPVAGTFTASNISLFQVWYR